MNSREERFFEALGITPGPWKLLNGIDVVSWAKDHVMENICRPYGTKDNGIISAAPEMLIILVAQLYSIHAMGSDISDSGITRIIESATNLPIEQVLKAWEEADEQKEKEFVCHDCGCGISEERFNDSELCVICECPRQDGNGIF